MAFLFGCKSKFLLQKILRGIFLLQKLFGCKCNARRLGLCNLEKILEGSKTLLCYELELFKLGANDIFRRCVPEEE